MTGTSSHLPLLARVSEKARRRKNKKKAEFTTINIEDGTPRRQRIERLMSVRTQYGAVVAEGIQARYTDELLQLVEEANYETCEKILEADPAKTGVRDEETQLSPLHVAAKNGQNEILSLLLQHNADCNAQDSTGQTPLHLAATKDHFFCCQTLLEQPDIQVNTQNKAHDTPLHHAAKEGRYTICSTILKHPSIEVNAKNRKGMSPLHLAAQENHHKVMQLLLNNKANWNLQDKNFHLPLHYAAQKGYPESCEILMSFLEQADRQKLLKKILKDGKTPLMLAAKGGHHKCCIKLTNGNINAKDKEGNTALHYAAIGGYENTVAELLDMGAESNTRNKKGNSPISEASSKKKINCLKLLVEKGAKLDILNIQLKTILHCAAEKNAEESLCYLLNKDLNMRIHLDRKDSDSCTPLHLAIKREAVECAEILLDTGASATELCTGGMTPLHLAAGKGYTCICEKLLAMSDVQVSKENEDKATPLHVAALHGSTDVCQMLIRKGARLTAVDKHGRTPLHVASLKGNVNLVRFLSKKGVPQRARDDTQSTALHLAASSGSLPACQALVASAKATITEVDQHGNLPLDRAFENEYDDVFKFLLHHLPYKDTNEDRMLRLHEYIHTALENNRLVVVEAIIDSEWWESGFRGENGHHCLIFRELIRQHPGLAQKAQDKCIQVHPSDPTTTYNFRFFEDNYYVPTATKIARSPYKGEGQGVSKNARKFITNDLEWKRQHPLSLMVEYSHHHLLQHPLTNHWLIHKWRLYMFYIFMALLFIEILSVASLNIFMNYIDNWDHINKTSNLTREQMCQVPTMVLPLDTMPVIPPDDDNMTLSPPTTENNTGMLSPTPAARLDNDTLARIVKMKESVNLRQGVWGFLVSVTVIIFLLELNYMWRLRREYFSGEHWMRTFGVLLTILVIIPFDQCSLQYQVLEVWQWQCGIVALLVAWLHLINTLNQLPMLSVFMPITGRFFKSFLKVLFYIFMIIFIFAFLFHLLLREHAAFSEVPQAIVKTIVWMLGDLGYDDTFLDPNNDQLYPIMTNFFFVIFVTTLGGFIINLAITQPSEKLDSFRNGASYHRASSRSRLFLRLDICFPYFKKYRTRGTATNNNRQKYGTNFATRKLLKLDTIVEEKIPPDPLQQQMEEQKDQITTLLKLQEQQHEDIRELKHQLNALIRVTAGLKTPPLDH